VHDDGPCKEFDRAWPVHLHPLAACRPPGMSARLDLLSIFVSNTVGDRRLGHPLASASIAPPPFSAASDACVLPWFSQRCPLLAPPRRHRSLSDGPGHTETLARKHQAGVSPKQPRQEIIRHARVLIGRCLAKRLPGKLTTPASVPSAIPHSDPSCGELQAICVFGLKCTVADMCVRRGWLRDTNR
jgi:hypothetical protein